MNVGDIVIFDPVTVDNPGYWDDYAVWEKGPRPHRANRDGKAPVPPLQGTFRGEAGPRRLGGAENG